MAKVTQHKLNKVDDAIHSIIEIPHPTSRFVTIDVYVPQKYELGSFVYVTISDKEPEGGAAEVLRK